VEIDRVLRGSIAEALLASYDTERSAAADEISGNRPARTDFMAPSSARRPVAEGGAVAARETDSANA